MKRLAKRPFVIGGIVFCVLFISLIMINIIIAMVNSSGYSGRPLRENGSVSEVLNLTPQELAVEYGIDINVPCVTNEAEVLVEFEIKVDRFPSDRPFKDIVGYNWLANLTDYFRNHFYFMKGDLLVYNEGTTIQIGENGFRSTPFFVAGYRKVYLEEWGRSGYIKTDDWVRLYSDYIIQNGLENDFVTETGLEFTEDNVRIILLNIDKQLYEKNIVNSPDYPYCGELRKVENVLFYITLFAFVVFVALAIWQCKKSG